MRKRSLCVAMFLTFVLPALALAAPTVEALTYGVLPESDVISTGVRDMNALKAEIDAGTLLGRLVLARAGRNGGNLVKMAQCQETALRVAYDFDAGEAKTVVFAARLIDGATAAGALRLPEDGDYTPDFELAAPLTPLATVKFELDEVKVLRFACLEADGATFVLATNGDTALLEKMAVNSAVVPVEHKSDDSIWCEIDLSEKHLKEAGFNEVSAPVKTMLALSSSDKTVRMDVWCSLLQTSGALSEMAGKPLEGVFTEKAVADAPRLVGSGPLMALLNLNSISLSENLQLSDVLEGKELEEALEANDEIKAATGLEWSDLLGIARHNITLGIAGKFSFFGAQFPGMWLHVPGLTGEKADAIVSLIRNEVAGGADFESGSLKGFALSMPVPVVVAAGDDGLIVAVMDKDQLSAVPEVPAELAQVVEPRGVALGFNFKDLQPELQRISDSYGELLLPLFTSDKEEADSVRTAIKTVLNYLGMCDAVELYSVDAECFAVELTPSPEIVNMTLPPVLPAPSPAEVPEEAESEPAAE